MAKTCKIVTVALSVMALLVGIILITTDTQIFGWVYRHELVLSPSSASLPMWRDLPAPLTAKMFLFNVTNAHQVVKEGATPHVEELGPYTFYEYHHKTNIVWNENNTITYMQNRTWVFAPELSEGDLNDVVTVVNPVAAAVGDMLRTKAPKSTLWLIDGFLNAQNEQAFVTHTANEIIFRGFDDPLLKTMNSLKSFMKGVVPDGAFTDKFGFFYKRNGSTSADGVYNMYTGEDNVAKMGEVHAWNYSTHHFFPGQCGRVQGSAGEFYPPGINKTYIQMYSSDLCRAVKFEYESSEYSQGIPAYKFVGKKSLFANGTDNPENACFNPASVSLPSGVFNASACRFGAPVFISQPHFHMADPYYRTLVTGLEPNTSKHQTYLMVEPESGIPVDVAARFQINVLIDKVPGITMFANTSRSFVPIMWFEDSMATPSNMVIKMKLMAYMKDIIYGIGWAIFGLGLITVILFAVALAVKRRKRDRREDTCPILAESENENVFK